VKLEPLARGKLPYPAASFALSPTKKKKKCSERRKPQAYEERLIDAGVRTARGSVNRFRREEMT
jgi:hypothetical protein